MRETSVKMKFIVEQDENGWPPVTVENLHVTLIEEGLVKLESLPFFFNKGTLGDVLSVFQAEDGVEAFLASGGENRGLVRVVTDSDEKRRGLEAKLNSEGLRSEYLESHGLTAIDIPSSFAQEAMVDWLEEFCADEQADFEEVIEN